MFGQLKQLQELKSKADQLKKELAKERITGEGSGGKVLVTIDGNQEVIGVNINEEIVGNKESIESGVIQATNDAIKKAQKVMATKMSQMGGLGLPGM